MFRIRAISSVVGSLQTCATMLRQRARPLGRSGHARGSAERAGGGNRIDHCGFLLDGPFVIHTTGTDGGRVLSREAKPRRLFMALGGIPDSSPDGNLAGVGFGLFDSFCVPLARANRTGGSGTRQLFPLWLFRFCPLATRAGRLSRSAGDLACILSVRYMALVGMGRRTRAAGHSRLMSRPSAERHTAAFFDASEDINRLGSHLYAGSPAAGQR